MRLNPEVIEKAFLSLKTGRTVRLFVDGDFKDVPTLKMFMDLCKARPDLKVYGYSKSWLEFVKLDSTGYKWPSNYLDKCELRQPARTHRPCKCFLSLPVVRGDFLAVKVDKAHIRKELTKTRQRPALKNTVATF